MSAEAAFLEALKANPADDTTRLVYADWLDEHDEAAKAAYLRAVVDLTTHAGGTPEYTEAATRLYTAARESDALWRDVAGGRFELVLTGFEPARKIQTIILLRELTGAGLAEAKAMSESLPFPLWSWERFEELFPRLLRFERITSDSGAGSHGAEADIRPGVLPSGAGADTVFDVVLTRHELDLEPRWYEDGAFCLYDRGVEGIARVLRITPGQAAERLRTLPLELATGLRTRPLGEFLRVFKMFCGGTPGLPGSHGLPPDAIQIIPRPAS